MVEAKKYPISERDFLRLGFRVGSTFHVHGRLMRIRKIGRYRKEGTQKVRDMEAVEISKELENESMNAEEGRCQQRSSGHSKEGASDKKGK